MGVAHLSLAVARLSNSDTAADSLFTVCDVQVC